MFVGHEKIKASNYNHWTADSDSSLRAFQQSAQYHTMVRPKAADERGGSNCAVFLHGQNESFGRERRPLKEAGLTAQCGTT